MFISVEGPTWACGCANCRFGIVIEPRTGMLQIYIERAILAQYGHVVFCECRAGHMARQHARRVWSAIEKKRDFVHPDVIANMLLEVDRVPTIHLEGATT